MEPLTLLESSRVYNLHVSQHITIIINFVINTNVGPITCASVMDA